MSRSSVDDTVGGDLREWGLSFLRSPIEFTADPGSGRVSGVRLEINTLKVREHVPYVMCVASSPGSLRFSTHARKNGL